jgi:serine/threonine protein kinase
MYAGSAEDDEKDRSDLGKGAFRQTLRMRGKRGTKQQGKVYAVKRMLTRDLRRAGMKAEDVHREAAILKGLSHTNIVCYVAHCETPKEICIVMEIAPGGSLVSLIDARPPPSKVTRIASDIASALEHIHSLGVLHRLVSIFVCLCVCVCDPGWRTLLKLF